MALYTGKLDFGKAIAAPLHSDRPDGLIPTVVSDVYGRSLGLCYSSKETIALAVTEQRGFMGRFLNQEVICFRNLSVPFKGNRLEKGRKKWKHPTPSPSEYGL